MSHYRNLCRRIRRLPLDTFTLNLAHSKLKSAFSPSKNFFRSSVDAKKYNRTIKLLDEFLVNEDSQALSDIYDLIFTYEPRPWVQQLLETNHRSLHLAWPLTHLITEFGHDRAINKYFQHMDKEEHFSLMEYFDLSPSSNPLVPLPSKPSISPEYTTLIENISRFISFISCLGIPKKKIQPLEVVYPVSKYGTPLNHAQSFKIYKQKVSYIKQVVSTYKPVPKLYLDHLIASAMHLDLDTPSPYSMNPNFARYFHRKQVREQTSLNPLIKRYCRREHFPFTNIGARDFIKAYVQKQYYIDKDNKYRVCQLRAFFNQTMAAHP